MIKLRLASQAYLDDLRQQNKWLRRTLRYASNSWVSYRKIQRQLVSLASGVLHVGAHEGEEIEDYRGKRTVWIEALPSAFERLKRNVGGEPLHRVVHALLGSEDAPSVTFFEYNHTHSSSLFRLGGDHQFERFGLEVSREHVLDMHRLDSILPAEEASKLEHWVLDVQGGELAVLRGAGDFLKHAKSLDIEVSTRKVYEGGTDKVELDDWLSHQGFEPLWQVPQGQHGSCIYVRREHQNETL